MYNDGVTTQIVRVRKINNTQMDEGEGIKGKRTKSKRWRDDSFKYIKLYCGAARRAPPKGVHNNVCGGCAHGVQLCTHSNFKL